MYTMEVLEAWDPQIIHCNRIFHYINHAFWGTNHHFRTPPYLQLCEFHQRWGNTWTHGASGRFTGLHIGKLSVTLRAAIWIGWWCNNRYIRYIPCHQYPHLIPLMVALIIFLSYTGIYPYTGIHIPLWAGWISIRYHWIPLNIIKHHYIAWNSH